MLGVLVGAGRFSVLDAGVIRTVERYVNPRPGGL